MTRPPSRRPTLLVVDDDTQILYLFERLASAAGFEVVVRPGGRTALGYLQHERADVVAVDLEMPDVGGLDVLRAIRDADLDCQVILMSGAATIDSAVEAVKLGAIDYLTKPFDFTRLKRLLEAVCDESARRRRLLNAEHEVAKHAAFCGMVGRGPAMQGLFTFVQRLAQHVRTALITGETGTGKEMVARALQQLGPRREKQYVTINCSAIVDALCESELFGHVKGAFTGATDHKPGLFEVADGGTLFLDEVGELSPTAQAKLLRVLESGDVQRVGATAPRHVDVHVLAATNRDLQAEVDAGRFRADLFYRLNVIEVRVPALRDRREDIPYLIAAFIQETARRLEKRLTGLTVAAEQRLMAAPWKGNVRELRNVIERACILAHGELVTERELSPVWDSGSMSPPDSTSPDIHAPAPEAESSLSTLEQAHILRILDQTAGNKVAAARMLGMSRRALYRRLERYGIAASPGRTPAPQVSGPK